MNRAARLPAAAVFAALLSITVAAVPAAQPARDADAVAAGYVGLALASNLALQGQALEVQRAEAALAAARARFLPEISLQARYTRADGGRDIEFPVGTLLNPAYQTLNELLAAQGQPPRFSPLPDVDIPFQREREQDTRLSLRQPLYAPAIPAAADAQRHLLRGASAASEALARRLRRDVTLGYLDWLKALRAREVLDAGAAVLDENLRVSQSLFDAGRVTEDQVLRARTEQLALRQQQREATHRIDQARSYVNFLLNRPLDTALEDASVPAVEPAQIVADGADRPELREAGARSAAADAAQRAARAATRPSLSLGIDAGTQGTSWQLGPGYNYVAASLVLSWKFFDGGASRAEADRARLAGRQARLQQQALVQQIELEIRQARDALGAAADSLGVARARHEAARSVLRIAERKRDAGAISQVEFLDARSAATAAELALNVARFELLQRRADLLHAGGDTAGPPATNVEGTP